MLVSDAEMLRLIRVLQRELVGAGPLAELLADPVTTDVVVNAPDDVRVDRGRRLAGRRDVRFADDAARASGWPAGSRWRPGGGWTTPSRIVDARLADGTRLHAVLAPVAASGTCLSLRVLRPVRHDLPRLQRSGSLPGSALDVLRACCARG